MSGNPEREHVPPPEVTHGIGNWRSNLVFACRTLPRCDLGLQASADLLEGALHETASTLAPRARSFRARESIPWPWRCPGGVNPYPSRRW